ncbi:MAG: ABC transporter ATP-binding protein [Anaplasmataceae bacterium]|nr:ABC transporter ATP-binding protein [Anaplasmataceae bacterium]
MRKNIIEVEGLVKKYGSGETELVVLKGLDLVVREGEFVIITGRSGSGKSTLLYQMGLLDYPNEGKIHISGENVIKMDPDDRTLFRLNRLGYVFQDYALIPDLTAVENIALPLMMQGKSHATAVIKATEVLERVGLGDKVYNLPSQLSGGQQQRVSIGRAIGHAPEILFADEPTANLDSETAHEVLENFMKLHKEGQTIVMVTHEREYLKIADRVILLEDGVVKSSGKHSSQKSDD